MRGNAIPQVRNRLAARKIPGQGPTGESRCSGVVEAAEDLLKKVEETCKKFSNPAQCGERGAGRGAAGPPLVYTPPPITQRIGQLLGGIESYTAVPTAWQLDQIKLLQSLLTDASAAARKLTQEDLQALNKTMNDAGVLHVSIPTGGRSTAAGAPDEDPDEDP